MSEIDRRPYKVDLTKDPRWGKIMDQETRIVALEDDLIGSYLPVRDGTYIENVLGSLFNYQRGRRGPKDWVPGRKGLVYGNEDVIRILFWMKTPGHFPAFDDLVQNALHFAVEMAVLPGQSDIQWAFEKAVDFVVEHEGVDTALWEPIMDRQRWSDDPPIVYSLTQKMNLGKDHVITFDASNARAVKALEKAVYADLENLSEKEMEEGLGNEFRGVLDAVVAQFWRILEKDVDGFDVENRMDFRESWKDVLKNEPVMVQTARDEFVRFLMEPT